MRNRMMNSIGSILRPGRTSIDTGLQGVVSNDTTTPIFNAMTGPLNSTQIKNVRPQLYLAAVGACECRVAAQFSNDGIVWSDASEHLAVGYQSAEGWNYAAAFTSIYGLTATKRLFVRFGVQVRNTSGSTSESMMARIVLDVAPIPSATIAVPFQKVWTKGHASNQVLVPFTAALPTDGISEMRVTFELMSSTGDLELQAGWQETDTPDDPTTWGGTTTIGSVTSTAGITYGTTFGAVTFTKKFFRGIMAVDNMVGTTTIEAARAALRIDVR